MEMDVAARCLTGPGCKTSKQKGNGLLLPRAGLQEI
jgi:hypothetical protein